MNVIFSAGSSLKMFCMVLLRRLPLLEDLERPYDIVGLYRGTGVEEVATGAIPELPGTAGVEDCCGLRATVDVVC